MLPARWRRAGPLFASGRERVQSAPVELGACSGEWFVGRGSGAWRRQRDEDVFVREARRRGLRSRAAFKLEAIDARDHLFRGRRVVVDLGAAPGGWSQVARGELPPECPRRGSGHREDGTAVRGRIHSRRLSQL